MNELDDRIRKYPEVLRYVGKLIYERGWEYYRENKIILFEQTGNTIRANVRGTHAKEYRVSVTIVEDSVHDSECDCPYWARCKHIAAVLIYYFELRVSAIAPGSIPDRIANRTDPERTILLKLDARPAHRVREFVEHLRAETVPHQPKEDRAYRLVFRIKTRISAHSRPFFSISPAVRLVKKNGTYGNMYGYGADKNIVEHTEAETKLLSRLLDFEDNADILDHHVDEVIEHPEIECYMFNNYRAIPVVRAEIIRTNVSFSFAKLEHEIPLFRPDISFRIMKGETPALIHCRDFNPVKSGIWNAVISPEGLLLYTRNDGFLGAFLAGLLDLGLVSAADANAIVLGVKQLKNDRIDAVFNLRSITIENPDPVLILELDRRFFGVFSIKPIFRYHDEELSPHDVRTIISRASTEDRTVLIRRDPVKEEALLRELFECTGMHSVKNMSVFQHRSGSITVNMELNAFLAESGLSLMEKGFIIRIGKDKTIARTRGTIGLSVKSGIDWFDVSLSYIDPDGNTLPVSLEPDDAYRGLLKTGGSYVLLDQKDLEMVRALLSEGMGPRAHLRVSRFNIGFFEGIEDRIVDKSDTGLERLLSIREKLLHTSAIAESPVPGNFNGTLREYQRAGYSWLLFLREHGFGGCLADDMGLGKTIQTLALLDRLKENGELGLSLLVVPVTTFANWENEIKRFSPDLDCSRHAGAQREKSKERFEGHDLILVSYQTLRNDHALFSTIEFDYIILDESQNIKNSQTKTYKAIRSLSSRHRLALTGTPVENSSIEIWALMEILNPGLLRTLDDFRRRFARPIQEQSDPDASRKLKRIIHPFILRRKKEDVLKELPEKEIITTFVELNAIQREAYDELKDRYRSMIGNRIAEHGLAKSQMVVLEGLLRLRQMALFPAIVDDRYKKIDSSKFDLLREMLDEILEEDHKVLVYSQFVTVLKIIEKYFKEHGYGFSYLDGSTRKRMKVIDEFQNNDTIRLFLLSLKAGGLGINLTAADYVILFDPWWNPAIEAQAIGRAHRMGQAKKVITYKFIAKDTVEEKILALQEKKEAVVRDIIAEDASIFKHLDLDGILDLFT